eukprot:3808088-Rhodomonas_salina.1
MHSSKLHKTGIGHSSPSLESHHVAVTELESGHVTVISCSVSPACAWTSKRHVTQQCLNITFHILRLDGTLPSAPLSPLAPPSSGTHNLNPSPRHQPPRSQHSKPILRSAKSRGLLLADELA